MQETKANLKNATIGTQQDNNSLSDEADTSSWDNEGIGTYMDPEDEFGEAGNIHEEIFDFNTAATPVEVYNRPTVFSKSLLREARRGVQNDIPPIYISYKDLDSDLKTVIEASQEALTKHGLMITQKVIYRTYA